MKWQLICMLLASLVLAYSAVQVFYEFRISHRFKTMERVFGYGIVGMMLMSSVAIALLSLVYL